MPTEGFESASRAILVHLQQQLGFKLWMTARIEGDDWIILQTENQGYDASEGSVFPWVDTLCSRMVQKQGPQLATSVSAVPAYADAPMARQIPIGAYLGVPLCREDGSLLGTLCAFDPDPQEQLSEDQVLPQVDLLAKLLGIMLDYELKAVERERMLERTREEAQTDILTGLPNQRGWAVGMALEEARGRRYGVSLCVHLIGIDDWAATVASLGPEAGDALIAQTAGCLRACVRESDLLARIDADKFAVLALECGAMGAERLSVKLRAALEARDISASIGGAAFDPIEEMADTVTLAEQALAADQAARQAQNTVSES